MLEVIKPGLQTTVQDHGRSGQAHLGFAQSGAADLLAASVANRLLLQPDDTPLLECTLVGPTLTFHCDTVIALVGAPMAPLLDGQPLQQGQPIAVFRGQRLDLGRARRGCRTYLAVKGGLQVPPVLGSCATQLNVGIGGWKGRALQAGDRLPIQRHHLPHPQDSFTRLGGITPEPALIAVIPGPHYREHQHRALFRRQWRLSAHSDRMGARLEGEPLPEAKAEILTEPVQRGTIQLPPSGQPIALMADSQPTGGYPKIAQIARADWSVLAQLAPGQTLRFIQCDWEQARMMQAEQRARLARLSISAKRFWREGS
ncbi:biotin-dependent carboxyltransferase family protein [Ferrimonas gelatinilytica]|uniref:Biotin-dependent carboxyltransferase family protein n=1 Tax=Ferrimonas gelatinilytica TaxID=1255257 RepID=A0ABP9RZX9_9GAMM